MRSIVYAVERGVTPDLSGDLCQVLSQRGNRNNANDTTRMVLYRSIGIEFSQPTRLRVFVFASPLAINGHSKHESVVASYRLLAHHAMHIWEYLWLKHCHWISDNSHCDPTVILHWFPRRLCPYYDDAHSPPRRWVTNGEALPLNFLSQMRNVVNEPTLIMAWCSWRNPMHILPLCVSRNER